MIGIYFSGTGNTKYCVETFLRAYGGEINAFSIENREIARHIQENTEIVFGYPVQFSALPKLVGEFIAEHGDLWRGRKIFVLATMGLFSGDGAGVAARRFRRYGAEIAGGVHLKMPDSIGDEKALKRPPEQNRALVRRAGEKLELAALRLKAGEPPREGLGPLSHLAGLFGQRLYFGWKTKDWYKKLRIDPNACVGCGQCADLCPLDNIRLEAGRAVPGKTCTMCYRCVNRCPAKAITLLGKAVVEQCAIERYL